MISIISLSLIFFLILIPHTRSTLFPFIGSASFEKFIDASSKSQSIDARRFWEMREFSAPGDFVLDKEGFRRNDLPEFFNEMIPISSQEYFTPFLIFTSKKWQSVELLTTINPSDLALFKAGVPKQNMVFETNTDIIYKKDGYTYIIFLRPIEVMKETNGFLDYAEYDKKFVENKKWLVISKVDFQ